VVRRLLLTGAGSGAASNLVRSLRNARSDLVLVGCHSDRFVLRKSAADRNYLVPPSDHPTFRTTLRRLITTERIDLLIPTNDPDVRTLSALRARLPCRLFLPSHAVIEVCQDKYCLAAFLRARGLPVPITLRVGRFDRLDELFEQLGPRRPLWCRIRKGAGSIGALAVNSPVQARSWINLWRELRGVRPSAFTLSEYLPGREYGVQGLWRDGTPVLIKMCEILSYFGGYNQPSGSSSTPALAKMIYEPVVIELCERVVRALEPRASGMFSVDLKEDRDGNPCVMEVNAGRFCMITSFYDLAGKYNMADAFLRAAFDEPLHMFGGRDVTAEDHYLVRDLDTEPGIFNFEALFEGIREVRPRTRQRGGTP
jgi:carbamoylphosphate synthase large subunit